MVRRSTDEGKGSHPHEGTHYCHVMATTTLAALACRSMGSKIGLDIAPLDRTEWEKKMDVFIVSFL
jgi:hypothetical protein